MKPTFHDILKAQSMQCAQIIKTPIVHSKTFSKLIGSDIYLKQEFLQKNWFV